ncbi:MAG: ParB/RepB/Spo0J family partition protein [Oscillospiraceae bacterium]|nr:ParB/RepB/Spo0J family partition protein [Oscillospiraceae bacterium]
MQNITYIPVDKIYPHPKNPRKDVGDVTELAESIKANGIMQNLTVVRNYGAGDDTYTAVIGHRRLAAAKLAGLTEVPCAVAEMTEREQIATMLSENIMRSDLTVYEQAQGFQMMLDLGSTVEQIAEESGFSTSTVRRRMKLLELDPTLFKAAEKRGATLADYAELDKLHDPVLKNKVLNAIGTANFRNTLKSALEDEKVKEKFDAWIADLEAFAVKVERKDYVGREQRLMSFVDTFSRWSPADKTVEMPDDADTVRYYYVVMSNSIELYCDKKEKQPSKAELERQAITRRYNEQERQLKNISKRHFELRRDFIASFGGAKKFMPLICRFAIYTFLNGRGNDEYTLAELLDLTYVDDDCEQLLWEKAEETPEYVLLAVAYTHLDRENLDYWGSKWNSQKSSWELLHAPNAALDELYNFLTALGYEMSDEELAMQDGTHGVFKEKFA